MAAESITTAPDPADTDTQLARLEEDLAAATARKLAALQRAAELRAHAKQQLRSELAASRQTLAEIDRRHAETIADSRDSAQVHVDQILADALRQAAVRAVGAHSSEATDVE